VTANTDFDLQRFLPFRLNRLAAEVSRDSTRVYQEQYGIDVPEWRVLATLATCEETTSQAIVTRTRTHKSTISRAVTNLCQRGWIAKANSAKDGREVRLVLSPEGRRVFDDILPQVLAVERGILDRLTDDQRRRLFHAISELENALGLTAPSNGFLEAETATLARYPVAQKRQA